MMKIPITLQLVLLTVALTGFYMMVGQSVPQKEVQPPVVIEIAEDISTEEMIEIGKGIFEGKAICNTCHTLGKSGLLRFPDLDGIATRAATRKPGYSALDYLAESLYEPDIFVVEGFNPGMPPIDKPPIGLTDQEILAVIAYLQTLGGEATVTMETRFVYTGGTRGNGTAPAGEAAADGSGEAPATATADATLVTYGCSRCHDTEQPLDPESPSLLGIGDRHGAEQILVKLVDHKGDDGLDQVTVVELQSLVRTLSAMRNEG